MYISCLKLIYVRDHLGVVVGEILPAGLSLQTGQEISPNEFEFDPDYHSYIGTQENIGLVVSKINGNMPSFHRLIESRIDKVIRRLPIDDNVLDRIFFYREYVRGISTTSKRERTSGILENVMAFNQDYLRCKDDNDDDEDNDYDDDDNEDHSINSYSNHLAESETSYQLSEERCLTFSQFEANNETLSLFDCLMNGPGYLAHGDTAKLLSYCKVYLESLPNTGLYWLVFRGSGNLRLRNRH